MRLVVVGLVLVLALAACGKASAARSIPSYSPAPPTPGASFTFDAAKGAHPVDGRSGSWVSPANEVMVTEFEHIVKVDAESDNGFDFIRVEFTGPNRDLVQVAHYTQVRDRETFPENAGMLVIANGLGCTDVFGAFAVDKIERDGERLVALELGFVVSCGGEDKPALTGRVHFQA